jgi:purine-binding chemotaxis protein CheW
MNAAQRPEDRSATVLRQRARQLARPAAPLMRDGDLDALAFSIGAQPCLLELAWVREVQRLRDLVPLPLAAPHLLGLAPWRGRMLPVLDLAPLLALAGEPPAPRQLLVLGRGAPVAALAVTAIHGLQVLQAADTQRRAEALEGLRPDIVRGLTADGLLLIDGARVAALHPAASP